MTARTARGEKQSREGDGRGKERRQAPRADVELVIQYARVEQFCQDYARNVSLGGIFIETRQPLEKGTVLQLRFELPGLQEPLSTPARVVRVITPAQATGDERPGMALQFGSLSEEAKQAIDALVMQAMGLDDDDADDITDDDEESLSDLEANE